MHIDSMVRKKGYKLRYRTGDVTIKLTSSCVTLHCINYPRPQSVDGCKSTNAVQTNIMILQMFCWV